MFRTTLERKSVQKFAEMPQRKLLPDDDSKVNSLNLITLRSISYSFPAPSRCGSSKLEAKLHISPYYFFREPSRRSFTGRSEQDDRSRRVECNRIQLDAGNAGPTSPVFFFS